MGATILALDLGTITGYALATPAGPIVSGTWNHKGGRFEGGGMRFLRFRRHLEELHGLTPVGEIVFEEVRRHLGTDAGHIYGGMLAMVATWCEDHAIPYSGVLPATFKKWLTGRGNATKLDVQNAVERRGYAPADENEADALAILLFRLARPAG